MRLSAVDDDAAYNFLFESYFISDSIQLFSRLPFVYVQRNLRETASDLNSDTVYSAHTFLGHN
jgi:hypothetical protein